MLMLRPLSIGLMASALAVATLPAQADGHGSASDLGVMSIQLKDVVKPQAGVQAQTQAAGTPNQAGLGGFLPLVVGTNSVFFADVQANANFADWGNSSSIINTTVAGTTISTSSRLGYRWLNGDRTWMYGLNAGYDTRPMSTGPADTGIPVYASRTAFFQQAAVNAEAMNDQWSFNLYGLIPTGMTNQTLNTAYQGGALYTVGIDAGYNLTPDLKASLGYYQQDGDLNTADGPGVMGRLAYDITNDLTIGTNLTYDSAFKSRFSADIKWRFNTHQKLKTGDSKKTLLAKLNQSPTYRNVRVHDFSWGGCAKGAAQGMLGGILTGDPEGSAAGGVAGCITGGLGWHPHW